MVLSALVLACYPGYHVTVIRSFRDRGTEDVFHGLDSKASRACCPIALRTVAVRKLDYLDSAVNLDELRAPPGNRLEALTGDRRGRYSIRINDQYRICFTWTALGPHQVEIVDYH